MPAIPTAKGAPPAGKASPPPEPRMRRCLCANRSSADAVVLWSTVRSDGKSGLVTVPIND
jgi:hypothetical protein